MRNFKRRCAVLTVSASLFYAYMPPVVSSMNAMTIVYAQTNLSDATYTEPEAIEVTTLEEIYDSLWLYGQADVGEDGALILTEDRENQVGGIYLSEKIDIHRPFSIAGQINLGDKVKTQNSASTFKAGDGISFLFLDANVGNFGHSGESLGLGGIKNSFGFKLDTHHNSTNPSGNRYSESDPFLFGAKGRAFGSFIYSNSRGFVSSTGADFLEGTPSNTFVPFSLTYGGKENPIFTFTYGETTFTKTVDSRFNRSEAQLRSFGVFASTIDGTNKQQIKLSSLGYTVNNPKIIIRYINDLTGEEIRQPRELTGLLGSTKEIIGTDIMVDKHRLVRNNLATAKGFQSENTLTLLNGTQTVTYTYLPIYKEVYPPLAKETNQVEQHHTLSASEVLQNADSFPQGTTIAWSQAPNTSTIGEKSATLQITYPDNTTADLHVTIQVISPLSNDTNHMDTPPNDNTETPNDSSTSLEPKENTSSNKANSSETEQPENKEDNISNKDTETPNDSSTSLEPKENTSSSKANSSETEQPENKEDNISNKDTETPNNSSTSLETKENTSSSKANSSETEQPENKEDNISNKDTETPNNSSIPLETKENTSSSKTNPSEAKQPENKRDSVPKENPEHKTPLIQNNGNKPISSLEKIDNTNKDTDKKEEVSAQEDKGTIGTNPSSPKDLEKTEQSTNQANDDKRHKNNNDKTTADKRDSDEKLLPKTGADTPKHSIYQAISFILSGILFLIIGSHGSKRHTSEK
ncbi:MULTISPECIES: Rib/alpha-like domain-containing protein [unclassified Granulicatella]|uniref:lectin-like domain-containing protein n=1 Tax=unclassified Granulicatella TaxID=2630493 RepID=UPI00107400CC|nr:MULTISPECIES: Rib/alpha-like domain-containing protein [unclassified Granulicatella]MBF0779642.1 MucBP domain-containing protein [Granulicatella sp. 19428wC4_WM01]TFU96300.1 hypothetical protein E4T68_00915 [Granulicatella sp. WM01]